MSVINGVAKKHDGTAIDYVSIFNWSDGKCIAQIKPDSLGKWEYAYTGNPGDVGITYVADGCKPITYGAYNIASDDPYFADVDLLLIADTEKNSYKDWSSNDRAVIKQYQVSIEQLEGKPAFKFRGDNADTGNSINGRIITTLSLLETSDYTLEFWGAQTALSQGGARFFELGTSDSNRTMFLARWEEYNGAVYINNIDIGGVVTLEPRDSILRHYAIMRKAGVTSFYINGVLQFSSSTIFNINQTNLTLGTAWPFNGALQGYIQQFRVTKLARYDINSFVPDTVFFK